MSEQVSGVYINAAMTHFGDGSFEEQCCYVSTAHN